MRLSGGRLNKARQGKHGGGSVPMGYQTSQEKELSIDTESAKTIQMIFALRQQGYTLRAIAADLNDNHVPSPRNGHWCFQSIGYILKNPLYQGESRYSGVSVMRQDLALI